MYSILVYIYKIYMYSVYISLLNCWNCLMTHHRRWTDASPHCSFLWLLNHVLCKSCSRCTRRPGSSLAAECVVCSSMGLVWSNFWHSVSYFLLRLRPHWLPCPFLTLAHFLMLTDFLPRELTERTDVWKHLSGLLVWLAQALL